VNRDRLRVVFSTGVGRVCATCGWPADDCRCSKAAPEPLPKKVTAKLRLETKGRSGKSVTIVDGLPRNEAFLERLAKDLKKACGTGGAVREGSVELQGDCRERLRSLLDARGYVVKG
jgi:translation initiation factor 1